MQANASKHKAMSHERMLKAEKQLEKEINGLMRKAEILDAQEDRRYGKSKRGSDLPGELRRRQDRLARIRQARKEMEAETTAAAARQRREEAEAARDKAAAARESDALAAEQADLNKKAEAGAAKAKAAQEKAIKSAEDAGVEPPDLEPLAPEAMPRKPSHEVRWSLHPGLQLPAGYQQRDHLNLEAGFIKYHVDHIVPLAAGGLHHPDNLRVMTAHENVRKGARLHPFL